MSPPPSFNLGRIGQTNLAVSRFSVISKSPSLWLDAADSKTITHNSGTVGQWRDKSGHDRHAAQNNTVIQPGFGVDSHGQYLSFNGGNLPAAGTIDYFELLAEAPGKTVFFVSDWEGNDYSWIAGMSDTSSHIFLRSNSYGISINGGSGDTGTWYVNGVEQGTGGDIGSPIVTNTPLVHSVKFEAGSPDSAYSRIASYNHDAGGFDGKIREVLFFDRYLDTFERTSIENYLIKKWGIL
ncbi:MAG: hypothetical protein ACRBDL_00830 [Alphaproteobacteria bacterium]